MHDRTHTLWNVGFHNRMPGSSPKRSKTGTKKSKSQKKKGAATATRKANIAPNAPSLKLPDEFKKYIFTQGGSQKFLVVSPMRGFKLADDVLLPPPQVARKLLKWVYKGFYTLLNFCSDRVSINAAFNRFSEFNANVYSRLEEKRQATYERMMAGEVEYNPSYEEATDEANAVIYQKMFLVFLLGEDEMVEGFAFVDGDSKELEIDVLCVAKKGRRAGTLLLDFIREAGRKLEKDAIRLKSVPSAVSFYEKSGYVPVRRPCEEDDDCDMILRL